MIEKNGVHLPPRTIVVHMNSLCTQKRPGTFQRAMKDLLTKIKLQFAWVYLEDIVIFWRTPDIHIEYVRQVLTLLNDAGMKLALKKGEFFTKGIHHLGHVIQAGHLEVSTRTIDAV